MSEAAAKSVKNAALAAMVAGVLALPLLGVRTVDGSQGIVAEWRPGWVAAAIAAVFFGKLLTAFLHHLRESGNPAQKERPSIITALITEGWAGKYVPAFAKIAQRKKPLPYILIGLALLLPMTPLASRYVLDVSIMVLTYIMLAWGLNITVGYAGLLDLGYVAFYAIGAYSYALAAQWWGLGFWAALPLAGGLAAAVGLVLGFPVLRLRGDYFAIVTLGFGEITRLVLVNLTTITGGPNGISGVPRPTLFGLEFARKASEGHRSFNEFVGLHFDATQRVVFLYYIILGLVVLTGILTTRLRRLPLGRAWEAFREDEIACAALGIDRRRIKLAAYALGALVAGLAGAFFAARQGFISPESFTFSESATILAIIILGGMGSWLGPVLATLFIIGLPEAFRDLAQYRMLAFGAGMVLIMLWRPGGLIARREPTVRLADAEKAA